MSNAWMMHNFSAPELGTLKSVLEATASEGFSDRLGLASYLGGSAS